MSCSKLTNGGLLGVCKEAKITPLLAICKRLNFNVPYPLLRDSKLFGNFVSICEQTVLFPLVCSRVVND